MDECYICRQGLGEGAERFCRCLGETGRVHQHCLSAWLTASGVTSCNFCGARFIFNVQEESLWLWMLRAPPSLLSWILIILVVIVFYFYLCYRALVIVMFRAGPGVSLMARVWGTAVLIVLILYGVLSVKDKIARAVGRVLLFHPRERRRQVVAIQD